MKAWSALRHKLGEATDLPALIEKARSPDDEVRRHARYGLAERLIGRGAWPSAAGRAVSELVVDAVYPETPDPAGLLELLARIAGADAPRVLFKTLDGSDPHGREVLDALDSRSPELQELTAHTDPRIRAHAMRLVSLAVPDAELPEHDADPSVDATLAIARGRRGLPVTAVHPHARALHVSFEHRAVDEPALADALGWAPDPALFPWSGGDLDGFIRKLLSIKHGDRMLAATVFSLAVERFPAHPRVIERVQIVGAEGFPYPVEGPDELSDDQLTWLKRCLAIPLPRNALEVAGIPERQQDARRFLGLDPPGLLERVTEKGPIWRALEGDTDAEQLLAVPVTPEERLELAGLSVFRPYWVEPAPADVLATIAAAVDPAKAAVWAEGFLSALSATPRNERPWDSHRHPAHANVALLQLHRAKKPLPAGAVVFEDDPARVAAVLAALGPGAAGPAVLAFLEDPDRADFQESGVLAAALPHLGADASLVQPVLRLVAGLLAQVHHGADDQAVLQRALAWAEEHDPARVRSWQGLLSDEERERLDDALQK
ncbi:MAG: hypothetical protein R3F61_34675 [Myxococcota bacterium]